MDHSTERSCAIVCGTSIASIERSLISNDLCRCSTSASLACCTSSCERQRERSIGLADAEPFPVDEALCTDRGPHAVIPPNCRTSVYQALGGWMSLLMYLRVSAVRPWRIHTSVASHPCSSALISCAHANAKKANADKHRRQCRRTYTAARAAKGLRGVVTSEGRRRRAAAFSPMWRRRAEPAAI